MAILPGALDIPLIARILAVADYYDAITSERCYREPMKNTDALDLMRSRDGKHFDPDVLRIFMRYHSALEAEVADFKMVTPAMFGTQFSQAVEVSIRS